MQACSDYELPRADAEHILKKVRAAVSGWRREATVLKIPRAEQELMAQAFAA